MLRNKFLWKGLAVTLACSAISYAANFGKVVPIHGEVADIALDQSRGRLYAVNFSAYRIEVVDTASNKLLTPISVPQPPSAIAISRDNHFLLIGENQLPDASGVTPNPPPFGSGGLTLIDLTSNARTELPFTSPVLAVAFGSDGRALVLALGQITVDQKVTLVPSAYLFDPSTQLLQLLPSPTIFSQNLPVPLATFPAQTIQVTTGVSGDGNTIYALTASDDDKSASSNKNITFRYDVPTQTLVAMGLETNPPLGPRSIAVNIDGTGLVLGWGLERSAGSSMPLFAQFPNPAGAFHLGSSVWDTSRNVIYANMPTDTKDAVLSIADTDNLTIRERIQLPELLSGKSILNSDASVMYSASQSGVMILPVGNLNQTPRVGTVQEDLLFLADSCNRMVFSQILNIVSLGSASADFTLSLPKGVSGVTLSSTTGKTPASVRVTIDPSAFQGVSGTTTIPLTISSAAAVNIPLAVRLLINTRDFNQRGTILNIPGKLVDLLADTVRNRLYILRQDKNLVLVYDQATMKQISTMRTGNTPVHMAMTVDNKYLLVGSDNSQIASVLDLDTLTSTAPIVFPGGHYPRAFGVANTGIFALVRSVGSPPAGETEVPSALLDEIDLVARTASAPATLNGGPNPSIFKNSLPTPDGVIASTPLHDYLMMALADGNVVEYDASAQAWTVSRNDLTGLSGAYGALESNRFLAGVNFLDAGLVPTGTPYPATDGTPSGIVEVSAAGIRTTTTAATAPGVIYKIDLVSTTEYSATLLAEAPLTNTMLQTPPIGQIGGTILSLTRTLAASGDQQTLYSLTVSGLTVISAHFDAPTAKPLIQSVVNSVDGGAGVAVGGLITVRGSGFTNQSASARGFPLPVELGDMCTLVNNTAIPLFDVSPGLIDAQLPFTTSGNATMVVKGPGGISDPFTFQIRATSPAFFHTGDGTPAIFRDDNGQMVNFTNPIHPGNELSIFIEGQGAVSPALDTGVPAVIDPLSVAQQPPVATLGGAPLNVISGGLVPGMIGAYQINLTVPKNVPVGKSVPFTVTLGGASTSVPVRVVAP